MLVRLHRRLVDVTSAVCVTRITKAADEYAYDARVATLRSHCSYYLIEAWGLGTYIFVAAAVAAALEPVSLRTALTSMPLLARSLFGLAMGATSAAIVYSPWGARSGAHFNPALTLAYAWLGKIDALDTMS